MADGPARRLRDLGGGRARRPADPEPARLRAARAARAGPHRGRAPGSTARPTSSVLRRIGDAARRGAQPRRDRGACSSSRPRSPACAPRWPGCAPDDLRECLPPYGVESCMSPGVVVLLVAVVARPRLRLLAGPHRRPVPRHPRRTTGRSAGAGRARRRGRPRSRDRHRCSRGPRGPTDLGERATLLQFSSAFCAPCRATRRVLGEVAGLVPGVTHVEVDAEHHLDVVRRAAASCARRPRWCSTPRVAR